MRTGVTATQEGMTEAQKSVARILLEGTTEMHNGFCIGGDEDFLRLADELGIKLIVGHPPIKHNKMTKYVPLHVPVTMRPPYEYLTRNHHIVEETQQLIAASKEMQEVLRSGTWSTVRRARALKRLLKIILPNGDVLIEGQAKP